MDSRRYDRNADQLCQVHFQFMHKLDNLHGQPALMRDEMLVILQRAIYLNNELGKMAEKGLI